MTDARPRNCPTCESPQPHLHPAMQFEGEVQPCKDLWHQYQPGARRGWLKEELEEVHNEVAAWPPWKRGETMSRDARREQVEAGMFTREQLDKALALIFHKGTPAMQEVVMEVLAHDGALRQALARHAQRLKELETRCNNFPIDAPMWRGVEPDDTCAECGGSGTKVYANTSTFHYSAGGQSMTLSVCDKCWGSGNKHRPWPSWKQQAQEVERVTNERDDRQLWAEALAVEKDSLQHQLAAMTAERDEAVESTYVPGSWSCPVCQFAQVNSVLCATSGRVRADTESVPLCPNDGTLMKRETWKGYAVAYEKSLVEKLQQLAASQAQVKELEAAHFTELKERLRYTGEYRDAKRKVEQLVTDLDAARQDAARLREAALWAMKKVKRLSTRAVDYKRADDFIQHEVALKGA